MRTVEEIKAEIDSMRQPVHDAEAEVERLRLVHQKALDEVEQARQAALNLLRGIRPRLEALVAELRKSEGVAKLHRLTPGQIVVWQQSNGWSGRDSRRARIVRISLTRVQIELANPYADEAKRRWVDPKNITVEL
jgi:hypothetical protein